ncbi:hypothetical protein D1872_50730 [compost metagenome]
MELYIDLSKGVLDTAKLVKKQVQVRGKNGKIFNRMQWVDPSDNSPVVEDSHHAEDDHFNRVKGLSDKEKHHVATRFLTNDKDKAHKFASATGMLRNPKHLPPLSVINHIKDNLHKVPQDHLEPHMQDHHLKDDGLNHPKLAIKHEDNHGLSDKEVEKRMGVKGPLDLSKITQGTPMDQVDSVWYPDSKEQAIKTFKSVFGSATKEGIEYVFSDPEGRFKATMEGIDAYSDRGTNRSELSLTLHDADGEHIGRVTRAAWRDKDGVLNIKNIELDLKSEHQGKGFADILYRNSEQYWHHLSGGHPFNVLLTANISVGVYAWAKQGFDFVSAGELEYAKAEFKEFCSQNGLDYNQVLKDCKVDSIDDLKHSWDFATLDDGNSYNLKDLLTDVSSRYGSEVKGLGHIGKAFMLGGKTAWDGIKRMNQDSEHEKVAELFHRMKKTGGDTSERQKAHSA